MKNPVDSYIVLSFLFTIVISICISQIIDPRASTGFNATSIQEGDFPERRRNLDVTSHATHLADSAISHVLAPRRILIVMFAA